MRLKITHLCFLAVSYFWVTEVSAQTYPGEIVQKATTTVMNPHNNGYVTLVPTYVPPVHNGFDTTAADYKLNCINQFEFKMYGIPEIGTGDVLKDNIGAACGITDLIPDKKGYSVYTIRDASNKLIFRFRLGNLNSSVEAYSILIDTDQKFGKVGDPGVSASTADPNWTAGNPGFEMDITLINNSNGNAGGVFVYDIDGIDGCPTPLASYNYDSHVQLAKADTYTCSDFDYFFDYYVPLDSVVAKFNANKNNVTPARTYDLATTTGLRYAALTNQNAGCSMQGKISDISGVDNSTATYTTSSSTGIYNSFVALVTSQCGTPLDDLLTGAGGFDKNVVHAPTINGPLNVKQQVITGSTVEKGIYIKIDVYPVKTLSPLTWYSTPNGFGETTEAATDSLWSITLNRQLAAYDSVVATTQKDKFTVPCAANGGNTSSTSSKVVTCLLEATLTPNNVSCNGASDGSVISTIAAAPNNGTSPYTYSWNTSPVQTTANAVNLPPGTYSLTLKDVKGCQAILTPVTVTQPAALSASVTKTNVSCNGANDGTITISSPSGGYGTYEYSINGGTNWQASGTFTGLANGTYNVLIRDAAHTSCTVDLDGAVNTSITQPAVLNATISSGNVTCNGASDGTITVSSPTGGYGTYEYSINGGTSWQSSGTFTALSNGTYNVLIRDAAHTSCTKDLDGTTNTTITQPNVLSATLTSTNISAFGASDGTITISSPSGGYGTYEYSINGGTSWQASGSFTGLAAGTYNVLIRDAGHTSCVVDLDGGTNTPLVAPSAPLTATVNTTNVTCNGANDGTITVSSPAGGFGTYEYSINGGTSWQSSGSFTGLANGTYNVQIRDAAFTTDVVDLDGSGNTVITQPNVLSATISTTNVTSFGANNGTITVSSPSGGYGTYEYSINGGGSWQSSGSFTGLAGGVYNVFIRDAAHTTCTVDLDGVTNTTILQPTSALSATVSTTNVTCNGANDGTITISSPSGGYGTYEYSINGGTSWQSSGSFTGLANATYNVEIRDAAYTTDVVDLDGTTNTTITQPSFLSATVSFTNLSANGANDGTITITSPTGGYGTYEYSINGGTSWQSSGSFTGLANGTYNVEIRDAAHTSCVIDLDGAPNTTLTQPAVLSATISKTNVTCNGSSDGTITISAPTGGYGTYEYSINGGTSWQSSGSFTGLANNTYDVRIRDAAHITDVVDLDGGGNTTITQPAVLSATVTPVNVTMFAANDGSITISSPTGGYGTYEYSINGGASWQSSGSFTGLSNGTYNVWIRDAAHTGCVVDLDGSANTVITQPATLSATIVVTNVTCNAGADGTITVNGATGGGGTYEYTKNGGTSWQASNSFTGLTSGTYDIQIRDAANHVDVVDLDGNVNTNVSQPTVLNATVTHTNVTAFGASDGTITISSPTGGHGTYEYSITGGTSWQASGTFTGLSNSTYNVWIRDAAYTSCVIDLDGGVGTPVIQPGSALSATVASTNVTCNGANDGTITVSSPSGGYGTYEYSKDGGTTWQASGAFTNLANATYDVKIRDAAQPTDVLDLGNTVITQPSVLNGTVTFTNVTANGANDGTITISAPTGGYGTYQYSITGGTSWQASGSFTGLSNGIYNIFIRDAAHTSCVVDLDGSVNTTIIQPSAPLSATVTSTNVTCNGASDGTITVSSPAGGYGTYEYSKDGGTTWQSSGSFTSLTNGTYNVKIRDAAYTTDVVDLDGSSNTVITQPLVLSASVAFTNASANGASDGTITITSPAGGSGSYQYSINGGTSWQASGSFTGLPNGTYNVFIRDAAHTTCMIDLDGGANTTITQPTVLSATVTKTNVTCSSASDGTITISAPSGGYGTYEYTINGGTTWQSSGSYSSLSNGTYNVKIRDAAHTTNIVDLDGAGNTSITKPAVLNATVTVTNITSNGASDGTITISSPTGGYGTYEYSINGGSSWQSSGSFSGLGVSSYNILIRDAAHTTCVVDLDGTVNTTISQPAALGASVSSTNVTCNGASDGTITVSSPTGGYGTYEYTINGGTNWQSSGSFSGLTNGSYDVKIRDAAYPTDVLDLDGGGNTTISQPAILSASVSFTNVSANGGSDGTITITSSLGGSGSYQYSINGGTSWQSSASFVGLTSGTYNVLIRDAAHTSCFIDLDGVVDTKIIQPASPITTTFSITSVTCYGGNDGTITINPATGGYGTYEYTIDGGVTWQAATGTFTGLASATYNVQVRDAVYTADVVDLDGSANTLVPQPDVLSAIVTSTNASFIGATDGTITVSFPIGGFGTYEYSIDGGATWQSSATFTGLGNGTYNVFMRDAAHTGCSVDLDGTVNTTIIQPSTPITATVTSTDVTCNGANDGTITISSAAGGYGTYEYSIDGGTSWQTSGSYTGLANATYDVQIRDKAYPADVVDLDGTGNTVISQPGVLSATITVRNVSSIGANDGTITISSPAGGNGTYEYSIDGGTNWQSSGSFTGLTNTTYDVRIRDAAHVGCTIDLDASVGTTIIQPSNPLSATITSTNVTCNGVNDGTITVSNPAGGYGTYEYSIDGGTTWQSSGSFTSLAPASTYNVWIRDAAYPADVVDLDGAANTTTIQSVVALTTTITPQNVTCNGANDGSITFSSSSGGYGTYEYSIDGGTTWQSSGSFTGLAPSSSYNLQIRDAAHTGCVVDLDGSVNTTITQPNTLTATVTFTNVTANGANDGTITVSSPSGGYGTYEYSIDGGITWQSSGSFTGLANATYNVQMRDAAHPSCVSDLDGAPNTTITQPAPLAAVVNSTNISCNGINDGTITISSPTGGYGTYEYSIDGGATWQSSGSYTGLAPATTYNVWIRDAAHPTDAADLDGASNTTTIQTVGALSATISSQNITCFGANDGSITFSSPVGGYGTYEYSVDGGNTWQSSGSFTSLAPSSTYNLEIRDAAHTGCVVDMDGSTNTPITQPNVLSASVTFTSVSTVGGNDGSITVNSPSGGSGSYEYSKDGGVTWQSSGSFTGLSGGTYNVYIRDADHPGCMIDLDGASDTPVAQPSAPLSATVTPTNPSCFGVSDGSITVTSPAGGYGTYEYSKDGGANWQASGTFTSLANGTYNIQIRDAAYPADVVDLDGSTNTAVTQPNVLSGTIVTTRVTSNGSNDGTITINSAQGGNGTYEYSIDGGATWQSSSSFTSLAAATYNVEIRDGVSTGCIVDLDGSVDTPIIQPSGPLAASVSSSNITCFGSNDGTITVSSPSGGYGNYEYSKDGGATWQSSGSFTGLMPNIVYDVQIRDKDQTTDVLDLGNITLSEPVVLSGSVSTVNPICNKGTDGSITINSPAGGSNTYEFSIDGGTNWQSLPAFTGLAEKATNYNVLIRDQAQTNCVIDLDGSTNTTLTSPSAISASAVLSKETCKGSDGAIDLSVTGGTPLAGTPSYTYEWSNGFIVEDIASLTEGTYSVIIKDANQCSLTQEFVIDLDCVLKVYQAVSPDGDGKNDYWRIDKIEQYPGNTVRLFDRFNNLVYETHGYSNETNNWTGQANHGLTKGSLPDDTYFYWVDLGAGLGKLSGFVILKNH